MRRPLIVLALTAALATGADAATAPSGRPPNLPSHETANAPGSISVPFPMSTAPEVPEPRSYHQLLHLWKRAGAAYGVPWQILGAINRIESDLGRNTGPSSGGAVGWMQFMPSTWIRWGTDANGDGLADPWNPEDAVYSAARYLAAAGAHEDLTRAIYAYNHADWYVQDVLELAQGLSADASFESSASVTTAPIETATAGRIRSDFEERLADARRAVTRARRAIVEAESAIGRAERRTLAAAERVGDPKLTDAEFRRLEAHVTRLVLAAEEAAAELERRRANLGEAVARLDELREEAKAELATGDVSHPAPRVHAPPQFSGRHVFPVGGGPHVVSVARDHHDYPAADIAAPAGSPVYALADAVVVDVRSAPEGRCGIGLRLRVETGETYLYCHLSYIEPAVVAGAVVSVGTGVGLVGSTGNSTGPHLHLQTVPAASYPQQERWFESFAGVAFRWRGDAMSGEN